MNQMGAADLKILLIEDNPGDARLLQEKLAEAFPGKQYRMSWARDLDEGLDMLNEERFSVLLLDLGLPASQGIDTITKVIARFPEVPIVVCTGLDDEDLAERALAAGAQDYVVKGEMESEVLGRAIRYSIERKRWELDLRRVNAELGGYTHSVSHDLRSPLSAMAIACELLSDARDLSQEELLAEVDEAVGSIRRNLIKCNSLIEDLLVLARAGQQPVEVAAVSVARVVEMILLERSTEIGERGIRVEIDDDLGTVQASNTHIYQLFGNLISNAIKHNDSPEPVVEIRTLGRAENGCHRYLVRDNGQGIPPESREQLMMPFVTGRHGGTGIGLSIISKIIDLYGGDLRVYNDPGACFEFELRDFSEMLARNNTD